MTIQAREADDHAVFNGQRAAVKARCPSRWRQRRDPLAMTQKPAQSLDLLSIEGSSTAARRQ